ncbi:MAG: DUF4143 domain-containing protein, partial [Cyclobacteriaceae bacterium]|nr:DUF4143 domain-containing protein [Cyclobacteriaceae bacterium]
HLYPIWQGELAALESPEITMRNLDERLIFGSYPELLSLQADSDKRSYLQEITSSYLLKDILMFEQIRHSHKLLQLLQLIAFQIGQEVSYDELAKQLGISKDTVTRYLDLLSKIFVIYRVGGYSTNLRKEIIKSAKWYFIDNGIRNAIINNFSSLSMRNDVGFLWENYLMTERLKRNSYQQKFTTPHFWRTYDRQEIDLIENADGKINAFEMKWKTSKSKAPIFFTKSYPEAEFKTISRDNYLDFIL